MASSVGGSSSTGSGVPSGASGGGGHAQHGAGSGGAPASSGEMSAQATYDAFWPRQIDEIRTMDLSALKRQELPLARIKKVSPEVDPRDRSRKCILIPLAGIVSVCNICYLIWDLNYIAWILAACGWHSDKLMADIVVAAIASSRHGGLSESVTLTLILPCFCPILDFVTCHRANSSLSLRGYQIMKLDEDVKMISAEAPVLFSKAAEMFITELTMRAWIHTEDNKRRTLQRNDIAMAITKYDQFDFLIDIVPRDDIKPGGGGGGAKARDDAGVAGAAVVGGNAAAAAAASSVRMVPDPVSYYVQVPPGQQQVRRTD